MKNYPIADLHGDLLCYLAGDVQRTANDEVVRCSIPQLIAGNVKFQVLPVFTMTEANSAKKGELQVAQFRNLPKNYPEVLAHVESLGALAENKINIMLAIENASSFCTDEEALDDGLKRLEKFRAIGSI